MAKALVKAVGDGGFQVMAAMESFRRDCGRDEIVQTLRRIHEGEHDAPDQSTVTYALRRLVGLGLVLETAEQHRPVRGPYGAPLTVPRAGYYLTQQGRELLKRQVRVWTQLIEAATGDRVRRELRLT